MNSKRLPITFKKIITVLAALFSLTFLYSQQGKHRFSWNEKEFLLDGKPFQIISGELHPCRIPKEYWRHRIQMVKAMGCNTVAAYLFWNYHEPQEGVFDFRSGNKNIAEFIRLCQEEGMWVLLRPGPYVCGEWDFGGLPPYLLKTPDIKIRCMDSRYMAAVTRYFNRLSKEVVPLQCTNGGPILMVQVENEYGSFGNDKEYMLALKDLLLRNKITVPFYTADGATPHMLDAGTLSGVAIGLDPGGSEADFAEATKKNPSVPNFSSETYPGWLTHWGEAWARPDTNKLKKEVEYLLQNKKSFNFYVIHGGTNFGFTAGANAFSPVQYQPDVTSYDYDAPINEHGEATSKYYMLRRLIEQYTGVQPPVVPAPVKMIEVPAISFSKAFNLWDMELPSQKVAQPKPMEAFDQNQGLISYKTKLVGHKSGKLKIWEPHDYALVFLNGKLIDTVYRDGGNWEVDLPLTEVKDPELEILVEGMGHINFAQFMIDRKGITDRVTLNGMTLMNWQITLYPFDEEFMQRHATTPGKPVNSDKPCNVFKGSFVLEETGDTYLDMSAYTKGMVYVNGHNLGRYWNRGPQQRLYCPAGWLKKGRNEVLVFDLHEGDAKPARGYKTMD